VREGGEEDKELPASPFPGKAVLFGLRGLRSGEQVPFGSERRRTPEVSLEGYLGEHWRFNSYRY